MSGNTKCTVYIGNLDERVSDRVLYDILIQAGRLLDLYIPRDKETERPKGYAFAEYESEEVADYAVRLFTGLVTLYNRTLRFAISGQDKQSPNMPIANTTNENSHLRPRPGQDRQSPNIRPHPHLFNDLGNTQHSLGLSSLCRFSTSHEQVTFPPGVTPQSNGYRSHFDGSNYDYSRRVFGATLDSSDRSRSRRRDFSDPIAYPSY